VLRGKQPLGSRFRAHSGRPAIRSVIERFSPREWFPRWAGDFRVRTLAEELRDDLPQRPYRPPGILVRIIENQDRARDVIGRSPADDLFPSQGGFQIDLESMGAVQSVYPVADPPLHPDVYGLNQRLVFS